MEAKTSDSHISFSYAYQPIVNTNAGVIVGYEALVRGLQNQPASSILQALCGETLYRFDEAGRMVAIRLAASLELTCDLHLNFCPRSLETSKTAVQSTLDEAKRCGIPPERIILEVTEHEIINNTLEFVSIMNEYRGLGVRIAIDDFGSGYAGLNLLAEFQPDFIKLDMKLVRTIESKGPRQAIVRGVVRTCLDLGIDVVAEGVETPDEYWWFCEEGIELFQGNLFSKPAFEKLPLAYYPR
jgi:blue light- and temperature-responsive anti-repressor